MKIGILVGSLRKESYNMKVAKFIKNRYKDKIDFNILDISTLPLFNEDIENPAPKEVVKIREEMKEQDGVLIITPEYNYSIPGGLKNALDWFSRGDFAMMNKPYMLMGASTGSIGTARVQTHIPVILNSGAFKMPSLPNNEFIIGDVIEKIDDKGNIIDEGTISRLDRRVEEFVKFVELNK